MDYNEELLVSAVTLHTFEVWLLAICFNSTILWRQIIEFLLYNIDLMSSGIMCTLLGALGAFSYTCLGLVLACVSVAGIWGSTLSSKQGSRFENVNVFLCTYEPMDQWWIKMFLFSIIVVCKFFSNMPIKTETLMWLTNSGNELKHLRVISRAWEKHKAFSQSVNMLVQWEERGHSQVKVCIRAKLFFWLTLEHYAIVVIVSSIVFWITTMHHLTELWPWMRIFKS